MCSKISKVAIYGRVIHEEFYPYFKQMLRDLNERGVCLTCYKPFYDFLREKCGISDVFQAFYEEDVDRDTDVFEHGTGERGGVFAVPLFSSL